MSDFYFENNQIVLTSSYLLRRGFCCFNGCKNCPYKNNKYILKTNNDLMFHVNADDPVLKDVNLKNIPFLIKIEEVEYTIVSCKMI